jgi:hypothetical protein
MPASLNQAVSGFEEIKNIHKVGIHSAGVTFGLWRMSCRKRKTIKASVRKETRRGGRERPNKLAM